MISYQVSRPHQNLLCIRAHSWQYILLWRCVPWVKPDAAWILHGCMLLPFFSEIMVLIGYAHTYPPSEIIVADFDTWLRNYSNCFRIFFVISSIAYAFLGIQWIRVFSSSQNHRWLIMGGFLCSFIIAASAIGALVVGSRLERLQTQLLQVSESKFHLGRVAERPQVFVLLATFFMCLAQPPIRRLAQEIVAPFEPSSRTSGSDSKEPTTVSSTVARFAPPSRRGESNSQDWDTETIDTYATTVSETRPAWLPPSEMPSIPPPAAALESHGRISVDSGETHHRWRAS